MAGTRPRGELGLISRQRFAFATRGIVCNGSDRRAYITYNHANEISILNKLRRHGCCLDLLGSSVQ